jgi:hypothetical protein
MNDRYSPYGPRDGAGANSPQDYTQDYGGSGASSAREYAAAGDYGQGRRGGGYGAQGDRWGNQGRGGFGGQQGWDRDRGERDWGHSDYSRSGYGQGGGDFDYRGGQDRGYGQERGGYGQGRSYPQSQGYDRNRFEQGGRYGQDRGRSGSDDRGFFERAGDEVRSWFGDEEAERRREADQRYDDRQGGRERSAHPDDHYHSWRRQRIAELDRDYDEYRQENAQRFHNEFSSWRTDRQGQRDQLGKVSEHMDVVGSDGSHVGTVDKVRGDRIILTKNDADAGGHHHSIPSRWIQSVDDKVTLRKTADEAKSHWKDEERQGALFGSEDRGNSGERDQNWRTTGNLDRSFSGTY